MMRKRATKKVGTHVRRDAGSSRSTSTGPTAEQIPQEEQLVDSVREFQERFRALGRRSFGVNGPDGHKGLPDPARAWGDGIEWYPLVAIGVLVLISGFPRFGLLALKQEMSHARGVRSGALDLILAFQAIVMGGAATAVTAVARRKRGRLVFWAGVVWSASLMFLFLSGNTWSIFALTAVGAIALATVHAVHLPFLMDASPPRLRVRVFFAYAALMTTGISLALAVPAGLASEWTWRAVLLALGAASIAATLSAARLKDPEVDRWEIGPVRDAVRREIGPKAGDRSQPPRLTGGEAFRRVFLVPTARWLLLAHVFAGFLAYPLIVRLIDFLEQRWRMNAGGRSLFLLAMGLAAVTSIVALAGKGERAFQDAPARLLRIGSRLFVVGALAIGLAPFSPWLGGAYVLFSIAFAAGAVLFPILSITLLSSVPVSVRAHASALAGIMFVVVGGLGGVSQIDAFGTRFGLDVGLAALAVPLLQGAAVLSKQAARRISSDLDRAVDEVVESEYVQGLVSGGRHLPLLACRNIDFSYGQVQVLFDVDFTVDDGEMVALLGTNGAGKSTLLRVISGLGLPSRGSIRYRGQDITFIDTERRLGLGITQIPGGRAVFGPLSVLENLRAFAYTLGANSKEVERAIERVLDAFPILAQRRNQLAATLSGGEQQMLGLSRALILKPRLLLIDELTLGLAPKIIGPLLDMVRQINSEGTAVVLVEQSVNIALELVQHAYFMEKGDIRFDGPADELVARGDLLRSVFLEGAARGLD